MSCRLQVLSTLWELFCEIASICLSNVPVILLFFLDGRAEALLCASNMFEPACFNRLRKRKISEWNCYGKRVSFLVITVASSSQSDVLQHLHNGTHPTIYCCTNDLFYPTHLAKPWKYHESAFTGSLLWHEMPMEMMLVIIWISKCFILAKYIFDMWPDRKPSSNNWSMT